jgi:Tfp pilus assembly protein PilF
MVMFALGLLSKPMLVSTPIVLLLLDYWPLQRKPNWPRLFIEKIPFFILALVSCAMTVWAQRQATGGVAQLPLSWRAENAIVSYMIYLRQMFWPADLAVFYPHPENTLSAVAIGSSAALLVTLTIVSILWHRRLPYLFTGWFWYVVMLLPVIGLVQVGLQGHADRYTYLPQIGLCLVLVWGICELTPRAARVAAAGAAAGIVIVLATVSAKQLDHWQSSEALWRQALRVSPDNDVAEGGLGGVLLAKGDVDGALSHFDAALHRRPDNVEVHRAMGDALMQKGELNAAIEHWDRATQLETEDVATHDKLGAALAQQGRIAEAVTQWKESQKIDPTDGNALNNLAWVLAAAPDPALRNGAQAVVFATRANERAGGKNPMVLRTLAAAYAEDGRFAEAVAAAGGAAALARERGNATLADDLDHARALYETNTPLRDASLADRGNR